MTVTADALRELHRIHRQLTDLRDRLARGPKQIHAREANCQRLQQELEKTKNDTQNSRMTADRKNVDLKSGEAKIVDLKTKLNTANNNKEYQALLDQIAAAEMANSVLADEILEGFELIDELDTQIKEAQQRLAAGQDDLAKIQKQVADTSDAIRADISRLEDELVRAEGLLPADFRPDYDRVVKARGEDALAQIDGDCCGGCYQQVTPNQMNELYMGRAIFCKSCGRLIYLPEGQTRQA